MKVFPGKRRLKFSRAVDPAVKKGLDDAFELFAGKHVQNNESESENNVLQSMISLKGNILVEKFTRRLRSFYIVKNNGLHVPANLLGRRHGPAVYFTRVFDTDYKTFLTNFHAEVRAVA
jgi:hypothetical protein